MKFSSTLGVGSGTTGTERCTAGATAEPNQEKLITGDMAYDKNYSWQLYR